MYLPSTLKLGILSGYPLTDTCQNHALRNELVNVVLLFVYQNVLCKFFLYAVHCIESIKFTDRMFLTLLSKQPLIIIKW